MNEFNKMAHGYGCFYLTTEWLLSGMLSHMKFVGFCIEECFFAFYIIFIDKVALIWTLQCMRFSVNLGNSSISHKNLRSFLCAVNLPNMSFVWLQLAEASTTKLASVRFFIKMVAADPKEIDMY